MNKQVSVTFMILGMLFTVCLIVANIVGQKLIRVDGIDYNCRLTYFSGHLHHQ